MELTLVPETSAATVAAHIFSDEARQRRAAAATEDQLYSSLLRRLAHRLVQHRYFPAPPPDPESRALTRSASSASAMSMNSFAGSASSFTSSYSMSADYAQSSASFAVTESAVMDRVDAAIDTTDINVILEKMRQNHKRQAKKRGSYNKVHTADNARAKPLAARKDEQRREDEGRADLEAVEGLLRKRAVQAMALTPQHARVLLGVAEAAARRELLATAAAAHDAVNAAVSEELFEIGLLERRDARRRPTPPPEVFDPQFVSLRTPRKPAVGPQVREAELLASALRRLEAHARAGVAAHQRYEHATVARERANVMAVLWAGLQPAARADAPAVGSRALVAGPPALSAAVVRGAERRVFDVPTAAGLRIVRAQLSDRKAALRAREAAASTMADDERIARMALSQHHQYIQFQLQLLEPALL
jgi:hypothetical protein